MNSYIHPSAIIEHDVSIGDNCSIWDNVHVRHNTQLGHHCSVGEKAHISYSVIIGNYVKINSFVYICTGVTIGNGVMISAGCLFTNDRYPRATNPDVTTLLSSDPGEHTLPTLVSEGSTLGAGCIIGSNLEIGRFAMVGAGSLVTRSVGDFHLAFGHPARSVGFVCRCGTPFERFPPDCYPELSRHTCSLCERAYVAQRGIVEEFLAAGV